MKNRVHAMFPLALILAGLFTVAGVAPAATKSCMKFSGTVLLTYANPPTIIIHIIKGKVNAATVFTMTPTTVYALNGQPATFDDVLVHRRRDTLKHAAMAANDRRRGFGPNKGSGGLVPAPHVRGEVLAERLLAAVIGEAQ